MGSLRIRSVGLLFVLLAAFPSCAYWTEFRERPEGAESIRILSSSATQVAVIESVTAEHNGSSSVPSQDFVQRFAAALRETGVFATVYDPANAHLGTESSVKVSLHVEEEINPNQAGNFWRGFAIGASFFTLSGVIPLRVDLKSRMQCEVTVPGARARTYEVYSYASEYMKFFSDKFAAGQQLGSEVTNGNINALANQIARDMQVQP